MRIARYIAAGRRCHVYCGARARDALLARGLIAAGHDAVVNSSPSTPPSNSNRTTSPSPPSSSAVHYHRLPRTGRRHLPSHAPPPSNGSLFERPALPPPRFPLRHRHRTAQPRPHDRLRPRRKREGRQKSELPPPPPDHLEHNFHPQVINLTNSLLSALAPELRRRPFNVPIVCTYQERRKLSSTTSPNPIAQKPLVALIRENARAHRTWSSAPAKPSPPPSPTSHRPPRSIASPSSAPPVPSVPPTYPHHHPSPSPSASSPSSAPPQGPRPPHRSPPHPRPRTKPQPPPPHRRPHPPSPLLEIPPAKNPPRIHLPNHVEFLGEVSIPPANPTSSPAPPSSASPAAVPRAPRSRRPRSPRPRNPRNPPQHRRLPLILRPLPRPPPPPGPGLLITPNDPPSPRPSPRPPHGPPRPNRHPRPPSPQFDRATLAPPNNMIESLSISLNTIASWQPRPAGSKTINKVRPVIVAQPPSAVIDEPPSMGGSSMLAFSRRVIIFQSGIEL